MTRSKPDDRSDNVEKLQDMVQNTKEHIEEAQNTLQNDDLGESQRKDILEKNDRREESIVGMRAEIEDEANDREQGKY